MRVTKPTWLVLVLAALSACSGGSSSGPSSDALTLSFGTPSGDGQLAFPTQALPQVFRVRLTQAGQPVAGTGVTWKVTGGGGSLSAVGSTTGSDGTATAQLTLGPQPGANTVTASVAGASGSPRTFTATAIVTGATATVDVGNNQFSPSAVAVTTGGVVTFRWTSGSLNHNVVPVSPATLPTSGGATLRDAPFSFDATFPTAGTYRFYCSNHGSADAGMRGSVLVQ